VRACRFAHLGRARRVLYGLAMKKTTKKLTLSTETVRALDNRALADVAGGDSAQIRCHWTVGCAQQK
jgi:hypothetical protein